MSQSRRGQKITVVMVLDIADERAAMIAANSLCRKLEMDGQVVIADTEVGQPFDIPLGADGYPDPDLIDLWF